MTSIFTFSKVSAILVQYFCIKQLSCISLLEDKFRYKQYCPSEIKHTPFALKECAALPVLYWYIRELRISLKKLLYQLLKIVMVVLLTQNIFALTEVATVSYNIVLSRISSISLLLGKLGHW